MACVKTIERLATKTPRLFEQFPLTGLNRSKHRCNARKLRVKVARISRVFDFWLERRWNFFIANVVPVDVPEECVAHNFLRICRSRAQPQLWLSHQQLLKYRY